MPGTPQSAAQCAQWRRHLPPALLTPIARVSVTVLLLSAAVLAGPAGHIAGAIHDPAGASVIQAVVTVSNAASGARRSTRPHEDGVFELLDLAPGIWDLSAEAPGFKCVSISGLQVQVDRATRIDIRLEIGEH